MRLIDADILMPNAEYKGRYDVVTAYDIANAPTVEPEPRKKGKWIDKSDGIEGAWNYCSVCMEQAIDLYDFCPNCGADMRDSFTIPTEIIESVIGYDN